VRLLAAARRQVLIAWRNARRNVRRTGLTVAAIAAGTAALVVLGGYMDSAFWGLRETTIRNHLGHLQVVRSGYAEHRLTSPRLALMEPPEAAAAEALVGGLPEVQMMARRLEVQGLISNGDTTLPFLGRGIQPGKETATQAFLTMVRGTVLLEGDEREVLVARGLAAALDLDVGARVTLLTSTLHGTLNGADAAVAGIFETGSEDFDQRAVLLPLPLATTLLGSERLDKLVMVLDDTRHTDAVAARVASRLGEARLGLEVKRWSDLATFYHRVVRIYEAMYRFIASVIGLLVVLGIANTVAMAVLERTREIGTLLALGVRRRRVVELFVLEGLFVGALGAAVGVALGVAICTGVTGLGGIAVSPPPGATRGYVASLHVVPGVLRVAALIAIGAALLGSLAPALRAARMPPARALREA
jgi:putative ABC transport system permease protein